MLIRITSKRQITLPARFLQAMGVAPGDQLELEEGPDGFILRPHRIDLSKLAPLRGKLRPGIKAFDIHAFRAEPRDPALRD